MKERAEIAEMRLKKYDHWLMNLVGIASSHRQAQRWIENLVAEAIKNNKGKNEND